MCQVPLLDWQAFLSAESRQKTGRLMQCLGARNENPRSKQLIKYYRDCHQGTKEAIGSGL